MSQKNAADQPVKDVVNASETVPVAKKSATVTAKVKPTEPKKSAAATVKKLAAKPTAAKKAVAEKPAKATTAEKAAPTPKASTKSANSSAPKAKGKVVEATKAEKVAKVKKQSTKKPKLVRDSFTLPERDYALFEILKQRALAAGVEVKKSELLRASLMLLAKLSDAQLVKTIGLVERIRTGRPKR